MTGSATLDLILVLAVLFGGGWLAWRGPVPIVRVLAGIVVVMVALAACGTLVFTIEGVPAP